MAFPIVVGRHSSLIGTGAYIAVPTLFRGKMVMGYQGGLPPAAAFPSPPKPKPEPKPRLPRPAPMDAGLSRLLGRIDILMRERKRSAASHGMSSSEASHAAPTPPDEINSARMTRIDPNKQGRAQTEECDEDQDPDEQECDENRMGEEKILREFDYVRAKVVGKGLVMGVATPPPGQHVIVKLNAGHIFKTYASIDLAKLGHVYQLGHLPDVPTLP